jgi:hypothetical protein
MDQIKSTLVVNPLHLAHGASQLVGNQPKAAVGTRYIPNRRFFNELGC